MSRAISSADRQVLWSSGQFQSELPWAELKADSGVCSKAEEDWLGLSFRDGFAERHLKARSGLLKGMVSPLLWALGPLVRLLGSRKRVWKV